MTDLAKLAQEILDGEVVQPAGESDATLQSPVPAAREVAPTMGKVAKLNYSHDAFIDLIIARPGISQNQIALAFGYSASWVSNVMASDLFQAKLAERKAQLVDPTLVASLEERIRGMLIRGVDVVMEHLEKPGVKPEVALRAVELGAKGLGLGGNAAPKIVPVDLSQLAERLRLLNPPQLKTIDGDSIRID